MPADAVRSVLAPEQAVMTAAASTYTTVQSTMDSLHSTLAAAYANAGTQAEAAVAAFEAQYCTPAAFTPGENSAAAHSLSPAAIPDALVDLAPR
jgi:hypothetical protein